MSNKLRRFEILLPLQFNDESLNAALDIYLLRGAGNFMTKIKFIVIALVLLGCFGEASAQKRKKVSNSKKTEVVATSSDVKITEDKSSNKREVRLAKQKITNILSVGLDKTIALDAPAKNTQQWASESAGITFTFGYGNGAFMSSEVNFIVDGNQVKSGDVNRSPGTLEDDQKERDIFVGDITVGSLEKIANGSKVQLKLGNEVYDIDKSARKNIKAFVSALKRK